MVDCVASRRERVLASVARVAAKADSRKSASRRRACNRAVCERVMTRLLARWAMEERMREKARLKKTAVERAPTTDTARRASGRWRSCGAALGGTRKGMVRGEDGGVGGGADGGGGGDDDDDDDDGGCEDDVGPSQQIGRTRAGFE